MTPIDNPRIASKTHVNTGPIICYVTDRGALGVEVGSAAEEHLLGRIRGAAAAGVDWIELREKDLDSRPLLDLTRRALLAARAGGSGGRPSGAPRLILNDRLDIARCAGADGVHLTEKSLPVSAVSKWKRVGLQNRARGDLSDFMIGASCHSLEGALRAGNDGADYIFFGPVFATQSKAAYGAPQGLPRLAEICNAVKIPVLAIGGITTENATACIEAGAAGIAAIGLFQRTSDLSELLAELRKKLG